MSGEVRVRFGNGTPRPTSGLWHTLLATAALDAALPPGRAPSRALSTDPSNRPPTWQVRQVREAPSGAASGTIGYYHAQEGTGELVAEVVEDMPVLLSATPVVWYRDGC